MEDVTPVEQVPEAEQMPETGQDPQGKKKPKKKRSAKSTALLVVAILCFAVAAVSGGILVQQLFEYQHANQEFVDLADEIDKDDLKAQQKVAKLQKKNKDAIGWLKVKDTRINYPVMYTPKDPEYYLHRNFKKENSNGGTPFVGENCTLDGNSMIVYAHHMRDGSMFASLLDFDDKKFATSHVIEFTLEDGVHKYKPIACFYTDISSGNYYHYWDQVGTLSEKQYADFVKQAKKMSLFDTGVKAKYDDKLLTLSTCSYGTSEQRFAVVAVEVAS